jgi:hypothetical protein
MGFSYMGVGYDAVMWLVIQGDELMTVGVEGFSYFLEVSWQSWAVVFIKLKEEIV